MVKNNQSTQKASSKEQREKEIEKEAPTCLGFCKRKTCKYKASYGTLRNVIFLILFLEVLIFLKTYFAG